MPNSTNARAAAIVAQATKDQGKNPAAVALGKLGGKKGGLARAAKLTPEQRSEIGRKAANTRWGHITRPQPTKGEDQPVRQALTTGIEVDDLYWLAGVVEVTGFITCTSYRDIHHPHQTLRLELSFSNIEAAARAATMIGVSVYEAPNRGRREPTRIPKPPRSHKRPVNAFKVIKTGKELDSLLDDLYPLLTKPVQEKIDQTRAALEEINEKMSHSPTRSAH